MSRLEMPDHAIPEGGKKNQNGNVLSQKNYICNQIEKWGEFFGLYGK